MKYRYLKVTGDLVWGQNQITQQDLIRAKEKTIDVLIDTQEGTQFDPDNNRWEGFGGE